MSLPGSDLDGVTTFNPELWKQLDVQVLSRVGGTGPFTSRYVSFDRRTFEVGRATIFSVR